MKPQPSPVNPDGAEAFKRFESFAKRLVAVPKAEYAEKLAEYEQEKAGRRKAKPA